MEYVRRGQKETAAQQYEFPYPSTLYGIRSSYKKVSLELGYQIIHDLNFKINYQYISNIDNRVSPSYSKTSNDCYVSFYYGL